MLTGIKKEKKLFCYLVADSDRKVGRKEKCMFRAQIPFRGDMEPYSLGNGLPLDSFTYRETFGRIVFFTDDKRQRISLKIMKIDLHFIKNSTLYYKVFLFNYICMPAGNKT